MLKNNKARLIIALLVAVGLWAYVLGVKDPIEPRTIKNIPVTYLNVESLAEESLVLMSPETESVSVSFTGQRSVTKEVKASDFKVTADIEGLGKGEHTIRLKVTGPENVDLDGANPQKVTVKIDNYISAEKPVSVVIVNQKNDDSEPFIVQVSDESVKVKGAESVVNRVEYIKAEVDAEKVGNSLKAINAMLVPVNSSGEEVYGVECEKSKVSVTTVLHNKKTVNLIVPVTDSEIINVTRTVDLPKTITVKGTDELLSQINEITCEPLDVSQIFEDTVIDLVPVLPDGIKRATNSEELKARIVIEGAATREFIFNETDIVFEGVSEGELPYVESLSIEVKVSGNEDVVSGISEGNFILSADVKGLGEGEHVLPLLCQCENNALYLEYNPTEIKVVIGNGEGES